MTAPIQVSATADIALPSLPKAAWPIGTSFMPEGCALDDAFDSDQMREYAKSYAAALLADKQEELDKMRADAECYRWLEANGTLSLKRIPSYGQKWVELRFPWIGDPFADRHKTLGDAVRAALSPSQQGENHG